MKIDIRLETPEDHYEVEELTREAFWRFWEPELRICSEHLLVHRLRSSPVFIPELNFVAVADGKIAGHIIYAKSKVTDDAGTKHETLTFGPLSVLPAYQNKGIGRELMRVSFDRAKELGYRAVIIFGNPDFYPKAGFRRAAEFGIMTPAGGNYDSFMAYPLYDGALDGINGRYIIDPVYEQLSEKDVLEFDKRFPPKEPFTPTPTDLLFDRLGPAAKEALKSLNCASLEMMTSKSEREITSLPGMDRNSIEIIRLVLRENGVRWGK